MKIRTKLLLFILLIVVSLNSVAFFLYYSSRSIQNSYSEMMERFLLLIEVPKTVELNLLSLNNYLIDHGPSQQQTLQANRSKLLSVRSQLSSLVVREDNEVALRNYRSMLDTFLEETDAVLKARRTADWPQYADHYREAEKVAGYIAEETQRLIALELASFHPIFRKMADAHRSIHWIGSGIFLVSTLLAVLFAFWFSNGLTEPISRLVRTALRLSSGDFSGRSVQVVTNDEIGLLGEAFNSMQNNIKQLIDEIRKKAHMEKAYQEQALKNLEMDRSLKSLELKALQSQIHPHFLFNTLNIIAKLAYIEGAERSGDLIVSVSNLLRYNLGKLDRPSTLNAELNHVKEYFHIQKARFRERVEFIWEVDESCLDFPVPCLTLQPIVENAFIHGIESLECGARIGIYVSRQGGRVEVRISDNGTGMDEEKIEHILHRFDPYTEPAQGHTTGLGLRNVATRLRLFYETEDCIRIESVPRKGTTVILSLPEPEREVKTYAQTAHR